MSELIDKIISESQIEVAKMGKKTVVVALTLKNGFEIIESASCVDPNNYDENIGKELCLKRIKEKLWELEAYKTHDSMKTES